MNRVYKVIWSKAKHCYVVTSEIAKGYGKSAGSKGVKALLSGLVALSIAMGGYGLAGAVFVESKGASEGEYTTEVYTMAETKTALDAKADKATTLAGYGITDAYTKTETDAALNGKANTATTLAGYGITDAYTKTETDAALNGKANTATTLEGYGITDAYTKTETDAALDKKADKATTLEGYGITDAYTKTEVDGKISAEENARKAADKDNLKVDGNGVISKVTGDDGTTSSAVNTLVLNKDGKNQITLSEDGIKVGKNSTTMDEKGIYAGSDYDYGTAKAALDATEGKIRGADGDFEVNTDGKVTAKGGVETAGAEIKTGGGSITAGKITGTELNTQGGAITGGMATVTGLTTQGGDISGGNITATGLNTQGGEINGGDIKSSGTIHATGKITGNGLDAGTGAISGGSLSVTGAMEGNSLTLKGGNLNAGSGTITTTGDINGNNINTTGKITTKDLEVTGGLKTDHITLGSEDLNQTDINKGKVTSKIHEISGAVEYTAESIFNKDGSSITVRTNEGRVDSTGSSTVGSQIITQYLGNNAVPGGNNVTRRMVRNDNGTFSMVDTAVNGKDKYSIVSQNAEERMVTVTDGKNTTSTKQTAADIKNTAKNGMISNTAKNLVNTASENMTNTVGKNLTTTVGGDSSLTAENITNEAKNKITNKALDVETDAASSIVSKVSNDYGSNTSTQLSHQTMEEMKAEGKTASYLRGAAAEKSELIDGDVKTTIHTIAGKTNTNITKGKNVSNSLQEVDKIASSVTDGTNTTVVNQDARSLASSITDGTKANNTSSTVDASVQRIQTDDTHYSVSSKSASKMEDALFNSSTVIDSLKDAEKGLVSTAVTDGATSTGISQNAKDINLSAAGGTIASGAKNISNTAAEKLSNSAADIENKASKSILNQVGENTSWEMTNGTVVESVKDASGKTNQTTTTAADTYQFVKDGGNTLAKRTSSTNDNLNITDGNNTYTKITTATSNKQTVTDGTETASTNLTKEASNTLIKNGTQSVLNHIAADTSYTVMNENGNGSRQQQTASEILDRVTDGKNTSEVKMTADGTTFENKAHNTAVKEGTVTKTTISGNTIETGQATMDYADVTKDLSVGGNATVENDLTVKGASEFVGRADFRNDVYVDENLTVAKETRTDTLYVDHDGYVGGNLNVEGNIETHDAVLSADSRQVVTGRQLYQTNERVDRLDNRIKKVGANAAALAALRPGDFNPDDKFSIAAGFGSYRNANAAALGLFYRPNENVLLSLGTSFGDGENMVNAGVSVKFGRGKSMAERRKEMADEVSSMRDEMRSQDERIAELEEMLKKQSELIEKLSKES